MIKYRITKEECQKGINGVCSRCGGKLTPLETIDNSGNPTYWCGCEKCCCFDNGVSEKVYKISEKLVDEYHFYYYSHFDESADKEYVRLQQIGGACSIVRKVLILNDKVKP